MWEKRNFAAGYGQGEVSRTVLRLEIINLTCITDGRRIWPNVNFRQ